MIDIFGDLWVSKRGEQADFSSQWVQAIEGLTSLELQAGIDFCRDAVFVPNTGTFLQACQDGNGGEQAEAYKRFVLLNPPLDDVEKHTRAEVGGAVRIASDGKAQKIWAEAYARNFKKLIAGTLPEFFERIAAKPTTKPTDHQVSERADFGGGFTDIESRMRGIRAKAKAARDAKDSL